MACMSPRILCGVRQIIQSGILKRKLSTFLKEVRPVNLVKHRTRILPWRMSSSTRSENDKSPEDLHDVKFVDPYVLVSNHLQCIQQDVRSLLIQNTDLKEIQNMSTYYLEREENDFLPMLTVLMGMAVNLHLSKDVLLKEQWDLAVISELYNLIIMFCDDIVDNPIRKTKKRSANTLWHHHEILNVIEYVRFLMEQKINNLENVEVANLLNNKFNKLFKDEESDTIVKTNNKRSREMAVILQSVAISGGADLTVVQHIYNYGFHIGMAIQLVSELLDFLPSLEPTNKSTVAGLKQGIATTPVLLARKKVPELGSLISRRFTNPGDVELANYLVHQSGALQDMKSLLQKHLFSTLEPIKHLSVSPYREGLLSVPILICNQIENRENNLKK